MLYCPTQYIRELCSSFVYLCMMEMVLIQLTMVFFDLGGWCFRNSNASYVLNTLRPRQNDRHFPDDILKWIFLNENVWISIEISLKFVPKGQINNIPALVQVMAWRLPGDKPLSEPMVVRLLTHICVTRPQWVKFRPASSNICTIAEIDCIILIHESPDTKPWHIKWHLIHLDDRFCWHK